MNSCQGAANPPEASPNVNNPSNQNDALGDSVPGGSISRGGSLPTNPNAPTTQRLSQSSQVSSQAASIIGLNKPGTLASLAGLLGQQSAAAAVSASSQLVSGGAEYNTPSPNLSQKGGSGNKKSGESFPMVTLPPSVVEVKEEEVVRARVNHYLLSLDQKLMKMWA